MTRSRWKSIVLTLLIATSLVLSYVLWQGNWQSSSGVSYTGVQTLAPVAYPTESDIVAPYQIVLYAAKSPYSGFSGPGSEMYEHWMKQLRNVRITNLKPVTSNLPATSVQVQYRFGGLVAFQDLSRWFSDITAGAFMGAVKTVTLYTLPSKAYTVVYVRFDGPSGSFEGETNLASSPLVEDVQQSIQQEPYVQWNATDPSFVPAKTAPSQVLTVSSLAPTVLSLVHSFFVNPLALTRIQESDNLILWTDGSRVATWDRSADSLSYTDPDNSAESSTTMPLSQETNAVAEFMRNHGGARKTTVLTAEDASANKSVNITLQTYVEGLPLVQAENSYQMSLVNGQVTAYQFPMSMFSTVHQSNRISILGMNDLEKILHSLMPTQQGQGLRDALSVQLGYFVVKSESTNSWQLVPVYNVSESGLQLWVLDAQTGTVLKGMNQP